MANHRNTSGYDFIRGSTQPKSPSGHNLDSSLANSTNCANLRHGYNKVSDGYIPGRLPLPDDFFPVPQLSTKEKKYLLGLAKRACKEVVYYSREKDGPMKWIQLSSDDGVDVFQGVDNCGTSTTQGTKALTYLRGTCKIHATIDEISDFFKLDTPAKLSGYAQTVGKDLLDQKTLLTLATPTPENPKHFVAIKWSAVESPSKVTRNRDFCYIECHDEFIDSNTKRRGWVKSIHSIRLPFCPPLHRSHGLVRGSFYRSGYIFTESVEKGCVDAVHTLHVDIKGNAPNWLKILVMKRRIKNIAEIDRHFQLQRLTQGKLLGDLELPNKEKVTRCQLCETRFGFFHRRRLCRKCGKVVCTPCGNSFLLDYAGFGPKKVQVCLKCSESVVYGTSVPMMDGAGHILPNNPAFMKFESSETRPAYYDSPPGSMIMLEITHRSVEENEYYMYNKDGNGIADMEEAKRMNKEFEETLKKTSDKVFEPAAHQAGFRTSPESFRSGISVPRETMLARKSSGVNNESPLSEQRGAQNDDNGLSLPPSNSEQVLHEMHHKEQMRSKQIQKLHQYATGTGPKSCINYSVKPTEYNELQPSRPRAYGIARNKSEELLRLGSELGRKDYDEDAIGRAGPAATTSLLSDESGCTSRSGITRPDLARSRSGSQGGSRDRYGKGGSPCHHEDTASRYKNKSNQEGHDNVELQRCSQQYFDARNAPLALVSGGQQHLHGPKTSDCAEHLFDKGRSMATSFLSLNVPAPRQLLGSELEDSYTLLSDSNLDGAFTSRQTHQSDDLENQDDEAFRLAMSAMRLYEEERGPNLQVTEKTRQVALTKMMKVYAREIKRSHSDDSVPYRDTISDTRHLNHNVGILPLLRQTVCDDRIPSFYGSPLPVFSHDDMIPARRRHRRAPSAKRSRGVYRRNFRKDTYAPTFMTKQKTSEDTYEYRDLSDLTTSAFQAFHINPPGSKHASKMTIDAIESFEDTDSSRNGYRQDADHVQPSVQVQRSSASNTHVQSKSDTNGGIVGAACAVEDSIESHEGSKMAWRQNSMYGVADLDTFSDMDLADLPHLMRKDDVDTAAQSSFADLQDWTGCDAHDTYNEGVEYVPETCLSDLLSSLQLEGIQHVDDDDSESQSSDASSHIDWQSSLQNKYPDEQERHERHSESSFVRAYSIAQKIEVEYLAESESFSDLTMELSESMVTQNDEQPQRHYGKAPPMLELLSEYCDSEHSSLPSPFKFEESQLDLEPEYLKAIENANNQQPVPVEGGR
ncbi:unnamed protein product [Peronospora farinosa]|uniref:FYVE-type domain-containing protein n=1 Tax=Peronospora farinosa TaxID=134698 RepID=A0AAV0T6F2_9STRA|nr:unnamed protein product [Peronospora farinosa]